MKKAPLIKYLSSLLLFGTNGIVASFINLASYEIVLTRTLIGSALLILLFVFTGGRFSFLKNKRDFLCLTLSGVSMGLSWMFLYEAYSRIGVSIASLLYYCGPVIVMALSPLLFGEKLTKNKVTGFIAVFIGVMLINGGAFGGMGDLFGMACGLLSAVTYALMVIFNKKNKSIEGLENSALQLFIAFITTLLFVLARSGITLDITAESVPPILLLGLVNTGLGCYMYFSSIGKLPVQTVAVCGYLEPLCAVVFSVMFLGEAMSLPEIFGAALILGGAVFSELRVKR